MEEYFCKAPLIKLRGFFSDAVLSTSEQLPDMTSRMQLHADVTTNHIFEETLKSKAEPMDMLLHVTCTRYNSPSPAQRFASRHGWDTSVIWNCYPHGCFAAIQAVEMGNTFLRNGSGYPNATVVHTELCSLHMRSKTPPLAPRCIFQSLFSHEAVASDLLYVES